MGTRYSSTRSRVTSASRSVRQMSSSVSKRVPELTSARQHPRVAGTFDARVPLAVARKPVPGLTRTPALSGPFLQLKARLDAERDPDEAPIIGGRVPAPAKKELPVEELAADKEANPASAW